MDYMIYIYAALALIAGIVTIYLLYTGKINRGALEAVANCLENVNVDANSRLHTLVEYTKFAVHAVEQLVDAGFIEKLDNLRKEKAINITRELAEANGDYLDNTEISAIEQLIEAEVYEMKKAQ